MLQSFVPRFIRTFGATPKMGEAGEVGRAVPSRAKWERYKEEAALTAGGVEEFAGSSPGAVSPSSNSHFSHSGNPGSFVNSPQATQASDTTSPSSDDGTDSHFGDISGLAGGVQKRLYATSDPMQIRPGLAKGEAPPLSPLSESPALMGPLHRPPPNTPAQFADHLSDVCFNDSLVAEGLTAHLSRGHPVYNPASTSARFPSY
jgi:hypothetical protein